MTIPSHGTIFLSVFFQMKFWIFLSSFRSKLTKRLCQAFCVKNVYRSTFTDIMSFRVSYERIAEFLYKTKLCLIFEQTALS